MDQRRKRLKTMRSLGEQEISDLFSDELSDLPCETCSDSESDSGSDREQQRIVATDSKSDSSSNENAGTATWGKVDKTQRKCLK
jgi:hypothetical protein